MAAHLVNPRHTLDHAVGRIQTPDGFIERGDDFFRDALIDFILCIVRQRFFASSIENHLAKRNVAQPSIFIQELRDELIDRRFGRIRWRRRCVISAKHFAKHKLAAKKIEVDRSIRGFKIRENVSARANEKMMGPYGHALPVSWPVVASTPRSTPRKI